MSKFNVGDKVRYVGEEHTGLPEFYPAVGTTGVVDRIDSDGHCWVQWPKGTTSDSDCWRCDDSKIELATENEKLSNEEIWEMLKPKMEKNGLKAHYRVTPYHHVLSYGCADAQNAIAIAYRSGYERAMKGRPFKIGEKEEKKQGGHWEPVDPENLPKEGTRVRYSREIDDRRSIPFSAWTKMKIGDETTVNYSLGEFCVKDMYSNCPVCSVNHPERFDMWMEDDE